MTPREKALELVVKMSTHDRDVHPHFTHYIAKQCALIAVDEVIGYGYKPEFPYKYWEEVKQEIEKL
jgi:hypothetical protein